jgi:hypothetical protein
VQDVARLTKQALERDQVESRAAIELKELASSVP